MRILRELSRDRVIVWGAADPRLSAESMARRLGVDPTTVRDRMRAWQQEEFLLGFTVLPNASLFGAGVASGAIRLENPSDKPRLMATVRAVEGVIGMMDHVGEWVGLGYVDPSAEALERTLAQLASIPGVAEVTPSFQVPQPAATVDLTPLDWRIVRALRAHPREPLSVAAEEVGVSTRTVARRYERMVEGRALWSIGMFDFGRWRDAIPVQLILTVGGEKATRSAVETLCAAFEGWFTWHVVPPPHSGHEHHIADLYFHLKSVGELEALQRTARGLDGVQDVETYHPLRFEMFGDWADRRMP